MITVSYNAYCAITKKGDNDIWTVRPRGVVPLLPLFSQIDVGATVNALLGDTFSRENNTHGSRFHDRDPKFASRILGAMTQSCYIGTRDIRSRVIRGLYCMCSTKSGPQWYLIWEFLGPWASPCGANALIAKLIGPTWGPSGADRTQVGLMLAPWTLLSGWANYYDIAQLQV